MKISKSLFYAAAFLIGSVLTASFVRASDTFVPPLPPKAIEPLRLPPEVERGTVRLRLSIDQSGHPRKIAILSVCDPAIEKQVLPAVAKWQFSPATKNGHPVEADVILPLQLVQSAQ